jgi:hypothetical protein
MKNSVKLDGIFKKSLWQNDYKSDLLNGKYVKTINTIWKLLNFFSVVTFQ